LEKRRTPADQRELERAFVDVGWRVTDYYSSRRLIVGNRDKLLILAYGSCMGSIIRPSSFSTVGV
jgi:hypothetical protein